jgi:hypothetical protein
MRYNWVFGQWTKSKNPVILKINIINISLQKEVENTRSEFLMAMSINITVLWDVA